MMRCSFRLFARVFMVAGIMAAIQMLPAMSVHAGESLWFLNKDKAESKIEAQESVTKSDDSIVKDTEKMPVLPVTINTVDGKHHVFKSEVAITVPQLQMGLMYRTQLADDAGMLFVFPYPSEHNFWMKNTLIPLDIIFIKKDGRIHHIHHNAVPKDLTRISSRGVVSFALEINGGMAEKLGIKEGDMADVPVKWVSEPPPRPEQMAE